MRRSPWRSPAAAAEVADGDGLHEQSQQQGQQSQHEQHLEAAAEAVLADRGCWPGDCARLAGEADIIASECPVVSRQAGGLSKRGSGAPALFGWP
jgi:hypothetical protein